MVERYAVSKCGRKRFGGFPDQIGFGDAGEIIPERLDATFLRPASDDQKMSLGNAERALMSRRWWPLDR